MPDDGRLFQRSKAVAVNLIKAWERETSNQFQGYHALNEIYQSCVDSSSTETLFGHKITNPVFTYLMLPSMPSMQEFEDQFQVLSPFFVRRINQCFEQMEGANDGYRYSLCLAARKLTVTAPTIPNEPTLHWDYEFKLALAKATLGAKVQGENLTHAAEWTYIADLLFRDRTRLGRAPGGGEGEKHRRWLLFEEAPVCEAFFEWTVFEGSETEIADDDGFRPMESGQVGHPMYLHRNAKLEDLNEAGEFSVDYQVKAEITLPASWFTDPWKAKRKMRGKQESMMAASRVMPWESPVLSINKVQELIRHIRRSESSPYCAILALSLFLGMTETGMKKMRVASFSSGIDPDDEETERLVKGDRYYDEETREICFLNALGMEHSPEYIEVQLLLRIPLPRCVSRHLPVGLRSGEKLFQSKDFTRAKRILKAMGGDTLRSITLGRLRSTFDAYFVHASGLPEISADQLSGTERPHLRSQHFYVSVDWNHSVQEWRRVTGQLLRFRGSNISSLFRSMAFREVPEGRYDISKYAGAVKTPTESALKRHVASLLASFPRDKAALEIAGANAWNAYIAYMYFFIAVCTGRRPQRDPFPHQGCFDQESKSLYIDDKWNRQFREARIVPLCNSLSQVLPECFDLVRKNFATWTLRGFKSECRPGEPFLIDEAKGLLLRVSPSTLDRLCSDIDGYFRGLRNGPRHFLLTRLHLAGLDQEVVDFISGHRHASREPEMSASPVSWLKSAEFLRDVIEKEVVEFLELKAPFSE